MQAVYRNQQLSGLNSQQQLLLQQQYLQLAAAGQIPGFPGAYPHPVIPGGGEQYLAGLPTVLPLPYYAGVPGWYPQTLLTNGAAATQAGLVPPGPSVGGARPATGHRPPSPAGSQTGSVTPGPSVDTSLATSPYQVIPANPYYDAKGMPPNAIMQLPGGVVPPMTRLLTSPAPHLPPTYSTLPSHVNLGSPISSISGSNFGARRDSLDRNSNPAFSPSLQDFNKTKGGWGGGGLTSYGAVGSIASPGLAGLAGSTGSLTPPPPSLPGLALNNLFGVNNRLAPGADRAFTLGGLYPATRTAALGGAMGAMGAMGVGAMAPIPFGSILSTGKSRHNSAVEKNSNRSRLLEDFR